MVNALMLVTSLLSLYVHCMWLCRKPLRISYLSLGSVSQLMTSCCTGASAIYGLVELLLIGWVVMHPCLQPSEDFVKFVKFLIH